ncbi:MAG: Hsp20/alpha crystallin family protein [Deltaproteobacteria bacterium]|nr:Hsp20/alpha crystallin family protein [Deltaproteobacteria bacterium]
MPRLIMWKDEQMDKLREDMDRLYNRIYREFGIPLVSAALRGIPLVDLSDIDDVLIVRAKIADIDPKDLDISITHDTLRISAKTKGEHMEDRGGYRGTQQRFGLFSRTLKLPCRVEINEVQATYSKGKLSIVMPKCKPERIRKIRVKVV